jgi:hypothetical protein
MIAWSTGDLSNANEEPEWHVDVSRLGLRGSQTYRLEPNGHLSNMTETIVLLWSREQKPHDSE